ncbi:hypothetical protein RRF57_012575 [Xylaria bambusicola]|uniref:Uncharacterized protein n=1 Tax=Xylaria bambusicola TaxID=326684 RepID=A0AAN7ZEY0_9PEZI
MSSASKFSIPSTTPPAAPTSKAISAISSAAAAKLIIAIASARTKGITHIFIGPNIVPSSSSSPFRHRHLTLGHRFLHIQILIPAGMSPFLARFTIGTEASEIAQAQLPSHMSLAAIRAERAEAAVVVWARREFGQRVDVQVQTLVAVGAVPVAHEEVAFGHLAQVIFVQELASFALFAEGAQPVLAYEGVVRGGVGAAGGGRGGVGGVCVRALRA